jgi:hypothetical protein
MSKQCICGGKVELAYLPTPSEPFPGSVLIWRCATCGLAAPTLLCEAPAGARVLCKACGSAEVMPTGRKHLGWRCRACQHEQKERNVSLWSSSDVLLQRY